MKVLYVDQFGKTTGKISLAQCECLSLNEGIDVNIYFSDNTELIKGKQYRTKITMGFHGAFEGNAINKGIHYLQSLIELKKYIKEEKFDIVHLQWFSLPWIEWIYVHSLKKYSKIVITVHDVIPFNNRFLEMKCLDLIYNNAEQLLLHTETSKKIFEENYKTEVPIKIITQGFCLKSDYTLINKNEAKKHFGFGDDSVVFLYYGTIRKSKGLDFLIKAIGEAHKMNKNVCLLAAGAFQKVNPIEYYELVRENLDDSFSFVNFSFVPIDEEKWYFSAADVICLPYLEITQSGVAQVGLMYDLPMIASDIGEMRAVTRQGENGELVSAGSIEELKNAIVKLAADEKLRHEYSSESKRIGENEFSVEIKAHKVAEVYRKICNCEGK